MASLNIMPFFTDAFMADCGYMPNEAMGAYVRILIHLWRTAGEPVPRKRLQLVAMCDDATFEIVAEHLTLTDAGYTQKKLVEIYAAQSEKSDKAKFAAGRRWSESPRTTAPRTAVVKRPQSRSNASAMRPHSERICEPHADAMQSMNQTVYPDGYTLGDAPLRVAPPASDPPEAPEVEGEWQDPDDPPPDGLADPVPRETLAASKRRQELRGQRLPEDFRPPPEWLDFAASEGFSESEADREFDKFRDYWTAQPGVKGRKLDWPATWRNWVRKSGEYRARAAPVGQSGGRSAGVVESLRRCVDWAKDMDRRNALEPVDNHDDEQGGPRLRIVGG